MAVPLMAIGMGLNFANSLFGGFQLLRGLSQAKKNQRPNYEIPQEIEQNLNQAQLFAQQGMPMEQYNRAASSIDRNQAFGLRSMSDRRGGLVGLAGLNQGANDAYNNLAMQDAQMRMQNLSQLYNARGTMATYRDKAFDINQMQPFQQRAAEAQALQGAGLRNIMGGLQGAGNVMSSQMMYNAMNPSMGGGGAFNPMERNMAQMGGNGYPEMLNMQQAFNPYQAMMNNYGNNQIGNPNFVQMPQFFNQKY